MMPADPIAAPRRNLSKADDRICRFDAVAKNSRVCELDVELWQLANQTRTRVALSETNVAPPKSRNTRQMFNASGPLPRIESDPGH